MCDHPTERSCPSEWYLFGKDTVANLRLAARIITITILPTVLSLAH